MVGSLAGSIIRIWAHEETKLLPPTVHICQQPRHLRRRNIK